MQSIELCGRTRVTKCAALPESETVLKLATSWENWDKVVTLIRTVFTDFV